VLELRLLVQLLSVDLKERLDNRKKILQAGVRGMCQE
jgi:hypothetical protein